MMGATLTAPGGWQGGEAERGRGGEEAVVVGVAPRSHAAQRQTGVGEAAIGGGGAARRQVVMRREAMAGWAAEV